MFPLRSSRVFPVWPLPSIAWPGGQTHHPRSAGVSPASSEYTSFPYPRQYPFSPSASPVAQASRLPPPPCAQTGATAGRCQNTGQWLKRCRSERAQKLLTTTTRRGNRCADSKRISFVVEVSLFMPRLSWSMFSHAVDVAWRLCHAFILSAHSVVSPRRLMSFVPCRSMSFRDFSSGVVGVLPSTPSVFEVKTNTFPRG